MKRSIAALVMTTSLVFASQRVCANAQVKTDVINDQSSLYADMGGPGSSVTAARLAMEDRSGGPRVGSSHPIVVADHQNKADLASVITRLYWFDTQGVDVIADVTILGRGRSRRGRAVRAKKNKVIMLASGPAVLGPDRLGLHPEHRPRDARAARWLSPTASARRWSRPAAKPGSSSPPTSRSATLWSATPRRWWLGPAAAE